MMNILAIGGLILFYGSTLLIMVSAAVILAKIAIDLWRSL